MLKDLGKAALGRFGFQIRRLAAPGSFMRPIGDAASVLADLKARGLAGRLVFDVGASDGAWTRLLRAVFPDARVLLVEPRAWMQPALERTCAATPGLRYVLAAAGAAPGQASLTDWDTGSTLLTVDPGAAPRVQVPVVTLDALAAQYGYPDLVKLDVEGFELEALAGASEVLRQAEIIIVETSLYRFSGRPLLHEVAAFMAERNFFTYDLAGFIRRPYDGAVGMLDVCFARRDGAIRGSEDCWSR